MGFEPSFLTFVRAPVLQEGTALGPRGPHVPWTGNAGAFQLAASAQFLVPFFVRAPARFIYIRLTAEIAESLL